HIATHARLGQPISADLLRGTLSRRPARRKHKGAAAFAGMLEHRMADARILANAATVGAALRVRRQTGAAGGAGRNPAARRGRQWLAAVVILAEAGDRANAG